MWEPGRTLLDAKLDAIEEALEYCGGNKVHTATLLGISIRGLCIYVYKYERLSKFRQKKKRKVSDGTAKNRARKASGSSSSTE